MKLTENITLYNVFVDPELIGDKDTFIELFTPVVYHHLCIINGFETPDKRDCIENIEKFTRKTLLPKAPDVFYFGSGIYSDNYYSYDWTGYNAQVNQIIDQFSGAYAYDLISQRLTDRIQQGFREYNPL